MVPAILAGYTHGLTTTSKLHVFLYNLDTVIFGACARAQKWLTKLHAIRL